VYKNWWLAAGEEKKEGRALSGMFFNKNRLFSPRNLIGK
jgi:hypothetical protein